MALICHLPAGRLRRAAARNRRRSRCGLLFLGALLVHLRARYYRPANLAIFLLLAIATLTVNLAYRP
jgi:hypothetical protein